ncbi:LOB domain-containing protein 2 [Jatropha curcas]|uniref:LOB domain-containing protein 2 n=1 Tax=Jatropha curcas TaxID=180498 RepID=UPI0005FB3B2E|nr:LOB domain-containing protein 2 [Jatropha curcas]
MQKRNNSNNNGGTAGAHPACASCKHQRKKCGEDCILAPYFPADRSREFQAVHKVFGVSNVMKLVRSVREEDRKTVADSLVWEAFCRQNDPILGPLGEYRKIQEELKLYKNQTQMVNQNQLVQQQQGMISSAWNGTNKGGGGGGGLANNNNSIVINHSHNNGNGNIIVDQIPYDSYPLNYVQGTEKVRRQEKLQPHLQQQQHSITTAGFNQQPYYLPGHFGSINGKTMDGTLWEGGI